MDGNRLPLLRITEDIDLGNRERKARLDGRKFDAIEVRWPTFTQMVLNAECVFGVRGSGEPEVTVRPDRIIVAEDGAAVKVVQVHD